MVKVSSYPHPVMTGTQGNGINEEPFRYEIRLEENAPCTRNRFDPRKEAK